jgi:hypothetical protein
MAMDDEAVSCLASRWREVNGMEEVRGSNPVAAAGVTASGGLENPYRRRRLTNRLALMTDGDQRERIPGAVKEIPRRLI